MNIKSYEMNRGMKSLLFAALCLAAASALPKNDQPIPGQYMITLKRGTTIEAVRSLLEQTVISYASNFKRPYFTLKEVSPNVVRQLRAHPLVETVDQDRWVVLDELETNVEAVTELSDTTPMSSIPGVDCVAQSGSYTGTGNIWHLIRISQNQRDPNAPYRYTNTGGYSDAYILDTGIDIFHDEFSGRAHHDYIASNLPQSPTDVRGHGTHVAGLVGGYTHGVAKDVRLYAVKVLGDNGSGSVSGVTEGIVHANRMANQRLRRSVINMSLGGTSNNSARERAINDAVADGLFVLASAGNGATDARNQFPSGHENCISVGASDSTDRMASFSNWGPGVDVIAPGVSTYSAGSSFDSRCSSQPVNRCIIALSGTSMSCPVTSGVAARHGSADNHLFRLWLHTIGSHPRITFSNDNQRTTPNRLLYINDC